MSNNLTKAISSVGSLTLVSRILGFVRDVLIARFFGAGVGADVFFVAFKIPNFLRRLFAEGAFSQAFVPVLTECKVKQNKRDVQLLIGQITGTLGGVLFLVTLTGIIAAPVLIAMFAPGFIQHEEKFDLAVDMLRLTFPYLFFISLTALASSILNSYGRFAIPAVTPALLNLCLIGATLWLAPQMDKPVVALAWGVLLAGAVQLLFQLPFLLKLGFLQKPRWAWNQPGVSKVRKLMIPALFGSSVAQINLLFDTLIASFLVTGSISWLYYSDRLVELPMGVFGIALATVILPALSHKHAEQRPEQFSQTLDWALKWVFLIGLPATTGLIILGQPILTTLFQYGEFSQNDVLMASHSLIAYAFGLLFFILVKVLATGFYSRQDTRTPVRVGIIAMLTNMVLNVILVFPLAHAGLALATSLSALLNATLLFRYLKKEKTYHPGPGWMKYFLQILVATSLMGGLLLLFLPESGLWPKWNWFDRAWHLCVLIVAAIAVYVVSLNLLGLKLAKDKKL